MSHDKPVLEIVLVDTGCAERTLDLLTSHDHAYDCELDDRTVTLMLNGESPSTFLAMLVTNGIAVEEVKNATKSLEAVYLDIVRQRGDTNESHTLETGGMIAIRKRLNGIQNVKILLDRIPHRSDGK